MSDATPVEKPSPGCRAYSGSIRSVSTMTSFALGDTLIATQVVSTRCGSRHPSSGAVRFQSPTVERLARHRVEGGDRIPPGSDGGPRPDVVPLSLAQRACGSSTDPMSAVNNIPVAIQLAGRLDVDTRSGRGAMC